jgi:hypothetical protein
MTDDRPVVSITGAGSSLGLASAWFLAARRKVEVSIQRKEVTRKPAWDCGASSKISTCRRSAGSTRVALGERAKSTTRPKTFSDVHD